MGSEAILEVEGLDAAYGLAQILFNAFHVRPGNSCHAVIIALVTEGECFDLIFLSDFDHDQTPGNENRAERTRARKPRQQF